MCDYTEDPGGREAAMVRLSETVWCDPCLTPLVKALNDGGIHTVASCCGHEGRNSGHGNIVLANGRVLAILPDLDYLSRVNTASALLAAAEHRATRAEAQSETRRQQTVYWQERAEGFEARIKAVRDQFTEPWAPSPDGDVVLVETLRSALDRDR